MIKKLTIGLTIQVGLIGCLFAQPDFAPTTARINEVLNKPVRITYNTTVKQAVDGNSVVSSTGDKMEVALPNVNINGKPGIAQTDQGEKLANGDVEAVGTVNYEVILNGDAVKVTMNYADGSPLGIYFYDGKDSKVVLYAKNQPDLPMLEELPGQKFSLKYFNPRDYNILFQDLSANAKNLHRVGTAYADKPTSPPEYEFVPSEDGSRLKQMNVYTKLMKTEKEFSEFTNFDGIQLPTSTREFKTNAGGVVMLDILTSDIKYASISEDEVLKEFQDEVFKQARPLPDGLNKHVIHSTAK